MKSAELTELLGVSVSWFEPYKTKRDAMALVTVTKNESERSVLISPRGLMVVDSNNYVMPPYERNVKSKSRFVLVGQRVAKSITWGVLGVLCLFSIALGTNLAQARVVLTDSMSPAIKPGDVIIATKPNFVAPEKGKVVIYTGKRFNGTIVGSFSHRIIGGDASNGFIVKGDKNESADVQRPGISDIEGVVLFTIPFLGLLLTPQNLTLLLFCGFGFWLIYDAFRMSKR